MSRKRVSILAFMTVAVIAAGLWLQSGGDRDRVLAQDAAGQPSTRPGLGEDDSGEAGQRRRDRRVRSRDDNDDPTRAERADRRRDRERRDDREEDDDATAPQQQPAAGAPDGRESPRGGAAAPPAWRAARPVRREDFARQYSIVYEKNIFLRDRPTYDPNPTAAAPTTTSVAPRRPEESYVLTGIVLQDGRHVAFIENRDTGSTQRVPSGAPIAEGKVAEVAFDALEFELAGKRTRVAIGRNLDGAIVFTPPPPAMEAAPAPAPGGGPTTGPTAMPGPMPGAPGAPGAAPG